MQILAVRRGAVVVATAALAALSLTTPAQARAEVFHFDGQNNATRRCMDDSFAYGLRAHECNRQDFQQFRFGDGTYFHELRNKVTGRCVDDSFAYGLRAFDCNNQSFQQWSVSNTTGGTTFKNRATGRCIDDSFAYGLRAFDCNRTNFQKWWGVHAN
ncbi:MULTISPECIES: RICIN domain-containing protein [Streptomyces]|uniref:RICIN domain-containing protein n=1 Tax=Streptomyces TaxID=1883 RepID=UPI00093985A6|nr:MULTISPECIES: RICIN domain-containing protein [unclassified Streptomyces]QNQ32556.1 RICIN domain-containing protein [Streptomyces sp. CB00271]